MRHSNQRPRGLRLPDRAAGFVALAAALAVVACGGSAATPPPSAAPTPVITPDPHLKEPVTADQSYRILMSAKLGMSCPNAILGNPGASVVKQINCTLEGWPLRITQYTSSAVLQKAVAWKSGQAPGGDEPPYSIAGLNVLITFGPTSAKAPAAPDADKQAVAARIVSLLDPLMWPLTQHSVVLVPSRTPEPPPAPASATPAKSAKPTAKP